MGSVLSFVHCNHLINERFGIESKIGPVGINTAFFIFFLLFSFSILSLDIVHSSTVMLITSIL